MKYSILINTCDKFDDCWNPFFQLWSTYWKNCTGKIYLNTEYKDYAYIGLDITAVKGCEKNNFPKEERATWSQCLRWALETIDTDIILYMQEDYFLKDAVKNDVVESYVRLMADNKNIDCIHLTDQSVRPVIQSQYDKLYTTDMSYGYAVSCQAALWRKERLLELIRDYENAWYFEAWGSKRAAILKHNYFVVDPNCVKLDEFEIVPYIFTGIIRNAWYKPVVELFEKNNIEIDYSKRGFFTGFTTSFCQKIKTAQTRIPQEIRGRVELLMLYFK